MYSYKDSTMLSGKKTTEKGENSTINPNDSAAFAALRQKLGVSRRDLLNAIQKAGNNIKKIERYVRTQAGNNPNLLSDI